MRKCNKYKHYRPHVVRSQRRHISATIVRIIGVVVLALVLIAAIYLTSLAKEEMPSIDMSIPGTIARDILHSMYDPSVDYMQIMIESAANHDYEALNTANRARNIKILMEHLDYKQLVPEEFLADFESYSGFSLDTDYLSMMVECCLSGDVEGGRKAANCRDLSIAASAYGDIPIDFDDLLELSKIITAECGANWLTYEWKMMVGEVVLNRVASPEFPNSIYEVIHQPGQYSRANTDWYASLTPIEDCVWVASDLLQGHRLLDEPSVVFQAGGKQGSGIHTALYDEIFGYTYLCYSSYPELYKED